MTQPVTNQSRGGTCRKCLSPKTKITASIGDDLARQTWLRYRCEVCGGYSEQTISYN